MRDTFQQSMWMDERRKAKVDNQIRSMQAASVTASPLSDSRLHLPYTGNTIPEHRRSLSRYLIRTTLLVKYGHDRIPMLAILNLPKITSQNACQSLDICTIATKSKAIKSVMIQSSPKPNPKGLPYLLTSGIATLIHAVLAQSAFILPPPAINPHAPIHPRFHPGIPPVVLEKCSAMGNQALAIMTSVHHRLSNLLSSSS
jgi:hypothetical protein